ncbi:MAG: GspE/PulE family protein [Patescibacteria group bacterium]
MTTFKDEKKESEYKKKLADLHAKEAEELAQIISNRYNLPYVDLSKISINTDALKMIPKEEARAAGAACFSINGKKLSIAVNSPEKDKVKEIIKDFERNNFKVIIYVSSTNSLESAWKYYGEISKSEKTEGGLIDISDEAINDIINKLNNISDIEKEINQSVEKNLQSGGISDLLEIILSGGLATGASDIHLEPDEEVVRLRYRIDGILQIVSKFNLKIYKQILSRIKLVSGLKLNITKTSQDGRFSIKAGDNEIEIRTSVVPGPYSESVVMRILNPESIKVSFEDLGIDKELFEIFDREIRKPNGMVLLTGPTGSGKTTTLYAFLRKINTSENKTITIEDPIEYHLAGINQTQVDHKKNYTFLSGLRAALRQDPDVIMVGEIRDPETANVAINASLTGHMVFSTLHTNNAAGAIPRLIDLKINPKILTSGLTMPIAQRLVRKLCQNCKQKAPISDWEKDLFEKIMASIKKKKPNIDAIVPEEVFVASEKGCEKCHHTGYSGRQGLFEAILMDEAVSKVAIENPNEKEIKMAAIPQGILDMRQDGILKVLEGVTSLKEVGRVVDLNEDII